MWLKSDGNLFDGDSWITENVAERFESPLVSMGLQSFLQEVDQEKVGRGLSGRDDQGEFDSYNHTDAMNITHPIPDTTTDPSSTTDPTTSPTETQEQSKGGGGGGIFHVGPKSFLQCTSPTCIITYNRASYGPDQAGSPHHLQPTPSELLTSPKDTFTLTVSVHDAFNNTVRDTPDQIIVTIFPAKSGQGGNGVLSPSEMDAALQGSAGAKVNATKELILIGQGLQKRVVENGVVRFGPLSALGVLNGRYGVVVWSVGLPSVEIGVSIVSCGPGEFFFLWGFPFFFFLAFVFFCGF